MDVEAIVGIVAAAFGIACVLAGVYILYVYRQRNEDAPFLTRLVHRDLRVSIASAGIAALVFVSYVLEPLPRPWGAVVIGVCLIAMQYGPIEDAIQWFRERREAGRE